MSGLFDICCTPQALKAAADWTRVRPNWDIELTTYAGKLAIRMNASFESFPNPVSGTWSGPDPVKRIKLTTWALRAAADWVMDGPDMADVYLLVDDRMLLVEQGDDRAGFDTGGEPASEEYLAVAPLDR